MEFEWSIVKNWPNASLKFKVVMSWFVYFEKFQLALSFQDVRLYSVISFSIHGRYNCFFMVWYYIFGVQFAVNCYC